MPTISTHYGITGPVPFADVEITADNRLYVDPHAIRLRKFGQPFTDRALRCLDTFAGEVTGCILTGSPGSLKRGEQLLQRFVEPWETRLGMTDEGFQGHGGSKVVGSWIWEVLISDVEALVRVGVLRKIEDLPLFVEGIDKDITSDITTRIIFATLAQFTAHMIQQYPEFTSGMHEVRTFIKQIWCADTLDWVDVRVNLPVADGKPLLLVPAEWARPTLLMSAGRYYETSVLSFAQLTHAVVGADGKLIKTPKDRLKQQHGLGRGRKTNLAVTLKAFQGGEDLLAAFKVFVNDRLDRQSSREGRAAA